MQKERDDNPCRCGCFHTRALDRLQCLVEQAERRAKAEENQRIIEAAARWALGEEDKRAG